MGVEEPQSSRRQKPARQDARSQADHHIRRFLREQSDLRQGLAASIGADAEELERNGRLIWTWDYLSLAVCLDWAPCEACEVPTATGAVALELTEGADGLLLNPWPFSRRTVTLHCDARLLFCTRRSVR